MLETKKQKNPKISMRKTHTFLEKLAPRTSDRDIQIWHWYQVYCWGHSYYTSATTNTWSDWHNTTVPLSSMYPLNEPCTQTCDLETRR